MSRLTGGKHRNTYNSQARTQKHRNTYNSQARTQKHRNTYNSQARTQKHRTTYNSQARTQKHRNTYNSQARTQKHRNTYNSQARTQKHRNTWTKYTSPQLVDHYYVGNRLSENTTLIQRPHTPCLNKSSVHEFSTFLQRPLFRPFYVISWVVILTDLTKQIL